MVNVEPAAPNGRISHDVPSKLSLSVSVILLLLILSDCVTNYVQCKYIVLIVTVYKYVMNIVRIVTVYKSTIYIYEVCLCFTPTNQVLFE